MSVLTYGVEVDLDLTVQVGMNGQLTFSGFKDMHGCGHIEPGVMVLAVNRETGQAAPAIVVAVNRAGSLVYFVVAWKEMKPRDEYGPAVCGCSH